MTKYLLFILILSFFLVEEGFSLIKYGDAFVEKGTMTIVREGQVTRYGENRRRAIPVLKNDFLRVGKNSYVKLKTVQQATVSMGSNAIFQVRPWRQGRERGYLRMLFGKALFTVDGSERRQFSLKTATAVVHVEGTRFEQETASNGATETYVREGGVVLIPPLGLPTTVLAGQRSIAIDRNKISGPLAVGNKGTPKTKVKTGKKGYVAPPMGKTLDSPAATSTLSSSLGSEATYISGGRVNQTELKRGKMESVSIGEYLDYTRSCSIRTDNPAELHKGEKSVVAGDNSFESDLNESEEMEDVTAMDGNGTFMMEPDLDNVLDAVIKQMEGEVQHSMGNVGGIEVKIEK